VPSCRLDTRKKIVSLEQAVRAIREHPGWVAVTGYFDPLTAEHSRRLREIRTGHSGIVVFLSDPPDPVLSARARAELIAALAMVDYVVLPQERASSGSSLLDAGLPVLREEEADEARFKNLLRRVQERHKTALER
jgi:bifunctional ADP-heptose synthase (sugar kinase/adenylyltransferase)